jgi:hypothetical protein
VKALAEAEAAKRALELKSDQVAALQERMQRLMAATVDPAPANAAAAGFAPRALGTAMGPKHDAPFTQPLLDVSGASDEMWDVSDASFGAH